MDDSLAAFLADPARCPSPAAVSGCRSTSLPTTTR
jgi:hypothetical protein